ncbi:MAG: c-type cytochrome [Actinomycetota bacterium]|nr:c-type cytochrome [Actinomycetota bacterium]
MTEKIRDDPRLVSATRKWQTAGLLVLLPLVIAFPAYRAIDAHRRADALASQQRALIAGGQHLWGLNCASCHGTNGQGVDAPALNSQQFLTGATDQQIHGIIAGGVPGTAMPAWWNEYGGPLTDQEILEVVAYLRSLQKTAPSVPNWRQPNG